MIGLTNFCHDPGCEACRRLDRRQSRNESLACSNRGQLLPAPSTGGKMIVYFAEPFIAAVIQQIRKVFLCLHAIHDTFRS
jgi:hypothetical protein